MLTNYKSCNEKKYLQFTDFIKSSKNVCKSTIYKDFTVIGRELNCCKLTQTGHHKISVN